MTTDSKITIRVSVDICLISSISLICLKELSKKSIEIYGPRFLSILEKKQVFYISVPRARENLTGSRCRTGMGRCGSTT